MRAADHEEFLERLQKGASRRAYSKYDDSAIVLQGISGYKQSSPS
jgi:hypothetical protein